MAVFGRWVGRVVEAMVCRVVGNIGLGGRGENGILLDMEIRIGIIIIPICIVHTCHRYISLQILQKAWISLKVIWKQE